MELASPENVTALEKQPVPVGPLRREAQVSGPGCAQAPQRALTGPAGGVARGLDRDIEVPEGPVDDRIYDRFAVREVRVDRGRRDPDLPRDGAQRDGLLAAGLLEQLGRAFEDLGAELRALPSPVPLPGGL